MDSATIIVVMLVLVNKIGVKSEGLSYDFYEKSCPQVEDMVRTGLAAMFLTDPTSPAALLRLMFHDCQVQEIPAGCDASILIDGGDEHVSSEMSSSKNFGIRKKEVISVIKSIVEAECPEQASFADILILAAREAVGMSGGPRITVPLGRRDSSSFPSYKLANAMLPAASVGVEDMLKIFSKKRMTIEESVAIMGAHTLGITHCLNILNRLYGSEGGGAQGMLDPRFEASLMVSCPRTLEASNSTFLFNDPTPLVFDNLYYCNTMGGHGLLRVDAELALDPRTAQAARDFAADHNAFLRAFSSALAKLSV